MVLRVCAKCEYVNFLRSNLGEEDKDGCLDFARIKIPCFSNICEKVASVTCDQFFCELYVWFSNNVFWRKKLPHVRPAFFNKIGFFMG